MARPYATMAGTSQHPMGTERVRFGMFEFDPASGELRREGTLVRLQPQPAQVLAYLVARPGEVVTRDALRDAVWGDDTFVDFDRGLNFCIAQIRSALGDAADDGATSGGAGAETRRASSVASRGIGRRLGIAI